ncbi:MAG: hypothetical protein WAM05_03990 [Candidatus Binataceae bacterium]
MTVVIVETESITCEVMRERCANLGKVRPLIFGFGRISVGSFGIFSSGSKNKLLENAAEFAAMGSFLQLFRSSIFGLFSGRGKD